MLTFKSRQLKSIMPNQREGIKPYVKIDLFGLKLHDKIFRWNSPN